MDVEDRISIITAARPYIPLGPPPDGVISASDRVLLGHGYAGILIAHPLPFLSPRWALTVARRATIQIARQAAILVTPPPVWRVVPV